MLLGLLLPLADTDAEEERVLAESRDDAAEAALFARGGPTAVLLDPSATSEQREAAVMDALRGHFRPEFLNRVDEIVMFDRLSDEDLKQIVGIQLKRVAERLEERNIRLDVTDKAEEFLAQEGYDPVYGARPLKRAIQRSLLDPLSLELLEGRFKDGDTVRVKPGKTGLAFEKQ